MREKQAVRDIYYSIRPNTPSKFKKSRTYLKKYLLLLVKAFPETLDYCDSTFESYKYGSYNEYAEEEKDYLRRREKGSAAFMSISGRMGKILSSPI